MFDINWSVKFKNAGVTYRLETIAAIDIDESVDNLADTATITLPEAVMNQVLNIGDRIGRGSEVIIQLGYDGALKTEFVGFVKDIITNDSSLKILCEDALFLFRVSVKDEEFKLVSLKTIAQRLIDQVNPSYKLMIDGYDDVVYYEKFVIHQATAYDVLKKLAEETKANIYFNTDKKELHIHPPYLEKSGEVVYSMQVNVEKSSLEYKKAIDHKIEVTVEHINSKGKVESYTTGTSGGDKITVKAGAMAKFGIISRANAELIRRSADMYDGSIDAWLIPFVKATYSAKVKDEDYPEKDGTYYVVGVVTSVSEAGCKRTVKLGVKLSI